MEYQTYTIVLKTSPSKTNEYMIRSKSVETATIIAQYQAIMSDKGFEVIEALPHSEYLKKYAE